MLEVSGPVDVLVNNAGIVHGGAFLDVPFDRHEATFRVNTLAMVAVTHAFLRISSRAPRRTSSTWRARGLHRPALRQHLRGEQVGRDRFSESIRLELVEQGRPHVRVTIVCPGYVGTGMFEGARALRLTRILKPERVADLTVRAVLANREMVMTPWVVALGPAVTGILPRRVVDWTARLFGVQTSLADWKGRGSQ